MNKNEIINAGILLVREKLREAGIKYFIKPDNNDIEIRLRNRSYTIEVKTTEKPRPGGGKGKDAVSWNIGKHSTDLIACVNLADSDVWLFTPAEMIELAQHPSKDKLYIYTDETVNARKRALKSEFKEYQLENYLKKLTHN